MPHDLVGPANIRGVTIRLLVTAMLGVLLATLTAVAPRQVTAGSPQTIDVTAITADAVAAADTQPPNVWWAPSDSILARDTASIAVGTWDDVGVVKVEYWVDGVLATQSTAGGDFGIVLQLAGHEAGTHQLMARAFDGAGNTEWTAFHRSLSIDRTFPSLATPLVSSSHTAGAFSKDPTIDIGYGAIRDNNGIQGYDWGWSTDPTAAASPTWVDNGLANALTSPPLADGKWFFHLRLVDQVGNVAALRAGPFKIDTRAPAAATSPLAATQPRRTFAVKWNATDPGGRIATFDVRYRKAAPGGSFGAVIRWTTATTATSATFSGAAGYRYCFATRARDLAGNVSTWSTDRCTRVP